MSRLLIHVEGQTEETFVNEVLAPHLYQCGYQVVSARLVGNSRDRSRRGGIRGWNTVKTDIIRHLKEDPHCQATTMVDYYALPREGQRAWPGRHLAGQRPFDQKAPTVHAALRQDIETSMGGEFDPCRFIPYVMMHEFEGLLFSDCRRFAIAICRPVLEPSFQAIRNAFATPEEINDSPLTAPSKRVEALVSNYQKPLQGGLAALEIGLDSIRMACPLFNSWLKQLEDWIALP